MSRGLIIRRVTFQEASSRGRGAIRVRVEWSDLAETDRTVENIVREMRAALSKADIQGPYILMPHSVSGIYSMYYADQYPEEVKAVIGIDPTLPGALDYFNESPPSMPGFLKYVAPSGIGRLALMIDSRNFLPEAGEGTYSKENLDQTKAISAWKGYNRNVVAEANAIKKNIDQTKDMAFPADMPVLFFTKEQARRLLMGRTMSHSLKRSSRLNQRAGWCRWTAITISTGPVQWK